MPHVDTGGERTTFGRMQGCLVQLSCLHQHYLYARGSWLGSGHDGTRLGPLLPVTLNRP